MKKKIVTFQKNCKNFPSLPSLGCHEQWVHSNLEETEHWLALGRGITRCLYLHNRHRVMPRTGVFAAMVIWYRLEAPPGACAPVLAPGRAMTRYQIPSLAPSLGQRYRLLLQPVLMRHQYRLQQQLVPLAWTFCPLSSSEWSWYGLSSK